jgi:O-succinylbenzoic acid--CoA ligase
MPQLVALALAPGDTFVSELQRCWDAGDAITVLDQRLPEAETKHVMAALAPTAIVDSTGRRSLEGGRPSEAGDAVVLATSGTTGEPKGVVLTMDAVMASALATTARLGIDPTVDKWLGCLPLAHIGGLSVVTRAILTGTPLVVHERFEAEAVMAAAHHGATRVSLVTKAMRQIDPTAFTTILLGGGAIPANRPPNAVATYGMTETGSGVVYDRAALPGVEIDITLYGEVRLRAPMLLRCYRTALEDIDPFDSDGWFATGDAGAIDTEGVLSVFGRMGDVIATGGEKVWPARLEPFLAKQPGIAEVAVVGRPDDDWGQRVVAIVVVEGDGPNLDAIREATKQEFGAWYAPKNIELVDSLPKTALGKVKRSQL